MSAIEAAVRGRVAAALDAAGALTGAVNATDAAGDVPLPYIAIGPGVARDWGTKDRAGREMIVPLTIRHGAREPGPASALAAAAEAAVTAIAGDADGCEIASVRLRSSRLARARPGWSVTLDLRIRALASPE